MGKMKITVEFKTQAPVTKRTVQIAEAFGLGIDEEKTFIIYKDFEIDLHKGDIMYITGDSGSGKSQLLKAIIEKIPEDKRDMVGCLHTIEIDPDEVLIESVGKDLNDAIRVLSMVGLNDAYLFLRRYKELSDGQKYRYRLARLIHENKSLWCADEWCSTLDRDMARIISYNFQKLARKLGKTAIVATCHTDLTKDLNPDIVVDKKFEDEVEYLRYEPHKEPCSVLKDLEIREVKVKDIKPLMRFHYKNTKVSFTKKIFGLYKDNHIVACIVYGCPPLALKGRNLIFGDKYKKAGGKDFAKRINNDIAVISRVVVHPKYRSIGLGQFIVRETLEPSGFAVVETLATMAKFNPFFEKAGMILVKEQDEVKERKIFVNIKECLEKLGFDLPMIPSTKYNYSVLKELSDEDIETLREVLTKNIKIGRAHV